MQVLLNRATLRSEISYFSGVKGDLMCTFFFFVTNKLQLSVKWDFFVRLNTQLASHLRVISVVEPHC